MTVLNSCVEDTLTRSINYEMFEAYGIAISLSQGSSSLMEDTTSAVNLKSIGKESLATVVQWLRNDLDRNRYVVESMLLEVASENLSQVSKAISSERLTDRAFLEFKSEMDNVIGSITSGVRFYPCEETKRLAQAVADLEPDKRTLEEWANRLTDDIWNVKD